MAARFTACSASAALPLGRPLPLHLQAPTCRRADAGSPACLYKLHARQVYRAQQSLRLGSAGFGAPQPTTSRISSRDVVCEVAVEVGGARSRKEEGGPVGVGARVRVKGPLKVYHVIKLPDLDLDGLEGEVKDVLGIWKGKQVSANLPYKVQFELEANGKPVKFFAHLKEGEFEVVDSGTQ